MNVNDLYEKFIEIAEDEVKNGILPAYLKENNLFQKNTHLDEFGLDSIALVSLLVKLSDATDSYFPDTIFMGNPTLLEIAERAYEYVKENE